jgi:hypothetical protein
MHRLHSSKQVASDIIAAVRRPDFAICSELEAAVLFGDCVFLFGTTGEIYYLAGC